MILLIRVSPSTVCTVLQRSDDAVQGCDWRSQLVFIVHYLQSQLTEYSDFGVQKKTPSWKSLNKWIICVIYMSWVSYLQLWQNDAPLVKANVNVNVLGFIYFRRILQFVSYVLSLSYYLVFCAFQCPIVPASMRKKALRYFLASLTSMGSSTSMGSLTSMGSFIQLKKVMIWFIWL